jgi:hypothetical protein
MQRAGCGAIAASQFKESVWDHSSLGMMHQPGEGRTLAVCCARSRRFSALADGRFFAALRFAQNDKYCLRFA